MIEDDEPGTGSTVRLPLMVVESGQTRVLHVDKFLRRKGGAATYMMGVGSAQQSFGSVVDYFSMQHPDNEPANLTSHFPPRVDFDGTQTAFSALRVAATMLHSRAARRGMVGALEEFNPDVVHLHNTYHQLSPSILAPIRERGIGLVMTVHDFKPVCPSYRLLANNELCTACVGSRSKHHAIVKRCMDGSLLASSMVAIESSIHGWLDSYSPIQRFIAPSVFMRDLLIRGGINADRVVHIPHYAESEPGGFPLAAERDGSVLFVGRLSDEKGLTTLVRAFGQTELKQLRFVGDGPERNSLEALAAAIAPGRVVFEGSCSKDQVQRFQRSSSIGVLPAEWYENQPMSILEAFGNGLPMIGSNLGGIPELIIDGETGLLFTSKDVDGLAATLLKMSDPIFADRCATTAIEYANTSHNLRQHLDRLDSLYREVRL
jgi:glycosyltransferase involved in cell wall biosynthesis